MEEYTIEDIGEQIEDLVERIKQVDERLGKIEPHAWKEIVSVMNSEAIVGNLDDLRNDTDTRLAALEAELQAIKGVVQGQSQMIGVLTQQLWGHGSTTE